MKLSQHVFNIVTGQICPYCDSIPEYTDSSVIYGKSYGMIYLCKNCDAYVGVHKGTKRPLGRLANKELRKFKKNAHEHFDKLWKNGYMSRPSAYKYLSEKLKIDKQFCHIGMFSEKTCEKVIKISKEYLTKIK